MQQPNDAQSPDSTRLRDANARYWRSNQRIVFALLLVWASVSLGCGILFAEELNAWSIGGCPLGFWFAQQGSILGFVLLILCYAVLMARLDRRHRKDIDVIAASRAEDAQ
jgi:putative solute:sodium symporter small subunit